MAILNSKFDILRGWPDGSAVAEDFTMSAKGDGAANDLFRAGHFVKLMTNGAGGAAAYTCSGDAALADSTLANSLGLIIEGKEDNSSKMSGTVTCLIAGGYVVRLHREAAQTGFQATVTGGQNQFALVSSANDIDLVAGGKVCVLNGIIEPYNGAVATNLVVGVCLKLDGANNTADFLIY